MRKPEITRGYGLLEQFLASQRSNMANKLIPSEYRRGRILDIGCGLYPMFLINLDFTYKHGLDKIKERSIDNESYNSITILHYDVEGKDIIPFPDAYFEIVTMLAVFEHIEPARLVKVLKDIYRVLKPGGLYIMTTLAFWTDSLLRLMARLKLVSAIEIEEHKGAYSHSQISSMLEQANFSKSKLRLGYFEMLMNVWATAMK